MGETGSIQDLRSTRGGFPSTASGLFALPRDSRLRMPAETPQGRSLASCDATQRRSLSSVECGAPRGPQAALTDAAQERVSLEARWARRDNHRASRIPLSLWRRLRHLDHCQDAIALVRPDHSPLLGKAQQISTALGRQRSRRSRCPLVVVRETPSTPARVTGRAAQTRPTSPATAGTNHGVGSPEIAAGLRYHHRGPFDLVRLSSACRRSDPDLLPF